MKSELIEAKKEKKSEFPLLAKSTKGDVVVLFTSPRTGTVIVNNYSPDLGEHNDGDWECCFTASVWEIQPEGTQVVITV